jgi:hypothetical protein
MKMKHRKIEAAMGGARGARSAPFGMLIRRVRAARAAKTH